MPFMKGPSPIRRTVKYLESYTLRLKDTVQVVSFNYNFFGDNHKGARDFVFWNLPQLQYKNPGVQMVTLKNLTPNPFIRIFLDTGEDILVDIDGKSKEEISDHLKKIICKTKEKKILDKYAMIKENPAHFGWGCKRQCMCEVLGQLPCPMVVQLPRVLRWKYRRHPELLEEFERNDEEEDDEVED